MVERVFPAALEQLEPVQEFVRDQLAGYSCPRRVRFQLGVAVEEVFVNIARHAYPEQDGQVLVSCEVGGSPPELTVCFSDSGQPFNPLEQPEADLTLPAEERPIGGLGILMVKACVDRVEYAYREGRNVLTLRKCLVEHPDKGL